MIDDYNNRVYIETLGCPKNEVDSQVISRTLSDSGWRIVGSLEDADIAIVNTCGFIEPAKAESIEAIWEMVNAKERGDISRVVVTGCLAERYASVLAEEIPKLDAVLGNKNPMMLPGLLINALESGEKPYCRTPPDFDHNWYNTPTGFHENTWAYIKISEGCDNRCTYCAIPNIRGRYRSAPMQSIVEQARFVLGSGVRELVLVGQDTTSYGIDSGRNLFPELLGRLSDIEGDFWIRVLYAHPGRLNEENVEAIARTPKVVPYLELPIQHISDSILERMGRHVTGAEIKGKVARLKELNPEIVLRTSLIVGFPGETDEDFDALVSYIEEGDFLHGGVFDFSAEDGTPAASYDGEVPRKVVETRRVILDMVFEKIHARSSRNAEGQTLSVLVESEGSRPGLYWGRTRYDAPRIDRMVRFRGNASPGQIVDVQIIRGKGYHLLGVQE